MPDDREQLIRHLYEDVLNSRTWPGLDDIYTSETVFHDRGQTHITDLAQMKKWLISLVASYPDLRYTVMDFLIAGDRGAVRWLASATHTQEGQDALVETEGIAMFRFRDDKITEQKQLMGPLLPEEAKERRSYQMPKEHVKGLMTPKERKA